MPTPGKNKTNFKTYEASTRLLAAVIATNNIKLDYEGKLLAKHVGGGATKDAINHRFRPIKQLAKMQVACVKKGEDPGELPIDKGEIQKMFGESTPSGIEWQFRDIKNLAKAQQAAVKSGENPAALPVAGTPSRRGKGAAAARTPGSKAVARTPGTGTSTSASTTTTPGTIITTGKRGRKPATTLTPLAPLAPLDSSEDESDPMDSDFKIDTPTKPAAKRPRAGTVVKMKNGTTAATAATTSTTVSTPEIPTNAGAQVASMSDIRAPAAPVPTPIPMAMPVAAKPTIQTSIFGDGHSPVTTTRFVERFDDSDHDMVGSMAHSGAAQHYAPASRPMAPNMSSGDMGWDFEDGEA